MEPVFSKVNLNGLDIFCKDKEARTSIDSITIVKDTSVDEYTSVYKLLINDKQSGADINIPKDLVVESGSVKECTVENNPVQGYVVGDKYIDLLIANSNNKHIYILVSDLVDVILADNKTTFLSDTNVMSAVGEKQFGEIGGIILNEGTDEVTIIQERYIGEAFNSYGSSNNVSSGAYSHARNFNTTASGNNSSSSGHSTIASAEDSFSTGYLTKATNMQSFACGNNTQANGTVSFSAGLGTIANGNNQMTIGMYNIPDNNSKYAFIIGNGKSLSSISNAFTVDWQGNIQCNNVQYHYVETSVPTDNILKDGTTYQLGVLTKDITLTLPETANNDIEVDFAVGDTAYNVTCDYLQLDVVSNVYYQVVFSYDTVLQTWFAIVISSDYDSVSTATLSEVTADETN